MLDSKELCDRGGDSGHRLLGMEVVGDRVRDYYMVGPVIAH